MKRNEGKTVIVILVVITAMLLVGCEDPFGKEKDDENNGTAPTVNQVNLYRYNSATGEYVATFSFAIGENAYIEVFATDPDLDMTTLRARTTHDATGNADTTQAAMDAQTATDMAYYTATEIIGPAGQWTAEFQITDAAGNNSSWYSRAITVTE